MIIQLNLSALAIQTRSVKRDIARIAISSNSRRMGEIRAKCFAGGRYELELEWLTKRNEDLRRPNG